MICGHLRSEIASTAPVASRPAVVVRIDLMDDGTTWIGTAICDDCARAFGLASGQRIRGSELEASPDRYPDVAPSCLGCIRERRPDVLALVEQER